MPQATRSGDEWRSIPMEVSGPSDTNVSRPSASRGADIVPAFCGLRGGLRVVKYDALLLLVDQRKPPRHWRKQIFQSRGAC